MLNGSWMERVDNNLIGLVSLLDPMSSSTVASEAIKATLATLPGLALPFNGAVYTRIIQRLKR